MLASFKTAASEIETLLKKHSLPDHHVLAARFRLAESRWLKTRSKPWEPSRDQGLKDASLGSRTGPDKSQVSAAK